MPVGYCTLEDLRSALRQASLPGDVSQDEQLAVDAITAETEPLEKELKRHWYEPDGISDATAVDIPTGPKTRDDEHDIPRHAGLVHGDSEIERHRYSANSDALLEAGPRYERRRRHDWSEPKREIRLASGDLHDDEDVPAYTRIRLDRRDVQSLNRLLVIGADGAYEDWVESDEYSGGMWPDAVGEDYYVRVNNGGWSELYLDVHALDDELASLSNAVYVDFDFGHEGIPQNVRRAVAKRAGAAFAEEAVVQIPEQATVYGVETKAERMREKAEELLEAYKGAQ